MRTTFKRLPDELRRAGPWRTVPADEDNSDKSLKKLKEVVEVVSGRPYPCHLTESCDLPTLLALAPGLTRALGPVGACALMLAIPMRLCGVIVIGDWVCGNGTDDELANGMEVLQRRGLILYDKQQKKFVLMEAAVARFVRDNCAPAAGGGDE